MASKAAEKQRFENNSIVIDWRPNQTKSSNHFITKYLEKHYMKGVYHNIEGLVPFLSIPQAWFQFDIIPYVDRDF